MTAPPPNSLLPDPYDRVRVEGPEAEVFLQGQLSQNLLSLAEDGWAWSFVLAPDGKMVSLVRVHRSGRDRFELLVEADFGDALLTRLARFKIRTDCDLTLDAGVAGVPRNERERIEAGVPRMGADLQPGDLAASAGLVDAAVDFTKGCFVGQELVARMDSRGGTAPTRLVRLRGSDEPPQVGAEVDAGAGPVGRVTSAAGSDDGWVALAMVSRKLVDLTASVDGSACAVEEL